MIVCPSRRQLVKRILRTKEGGKQVQQVAANSTVIAQGAFACCRVPGTTLQTTCTCSSPSPTLDSDGEPPFLATRCLVLMSVWHCHVYSVDGNRASPLRLVQLAMLEVLSPVGSEIFTSAHFSDDLRHLLWRTTHGCPSDNLCCEGPCLCPPRTPSAHRPPATAGTSTALLPPVRFVALTAVLQ